MITVLLVLIHVCLALPLTAQRETIYPFFVFNNGVKDEVYDTVEKQAQLLKSLGFDGMEMRGIDGLAETLSVLERNNLQLYTLYININLDDTENPYDPGLREALKMLKGRSAMPWFYITSKQYAPSSSENDMIAVPILREIADMANEYDVKIMIYPHVNFWVDNVDDAIRVAQKVNRRNLGITFNLCHFLADQGTRAPTTFISTVDKAMPYLFAISMNGADRPTDEIMQSKDLWKYFIQPLGEGNYDTFQYLQAFVERGFRGPVGLQCYNIKSDKAEHLKKSMTTWKSFQRKLHDHE